MRRRIIFYVSDHNFGHATRTIGLIRSLQQLGDFEIIVKNANAFELLSRSLPKISLMKMQTDVGPIVNTATNALDLEATYSEFAEWIEDEDRWMQSEIANFMKRPADLIVSDISPMALKLAEKVKCPSIMIGNFSWIDILQELPDHPKKSDIITWLENAFASCNHAIKLPLSMTMKGPKRVYEAALLHRNVTTSREQIRKNLGIEKSSQLVVLTFGGQSSSKVLVHSNPRVTVVHLSPFHIAANGSRVLVDYPETQDIIAASDMVIAKAGYSIISESITFCKPMLLIPRRGYPEDKVLCKKASELGVAEILSDPIPPLEIRIPSREGISELQRRAYEKKLFPFENYRRPSELIMSLLS